MNPDAIALHRNFRHLGHDRFVQVATGYPACAAYWRGLSPPRQLCRPFENRPQALVDRIVAQVTKAERQRVCASCVSQLVNKAL
jgi:hypothetical protein